MVHSMSVFLVLLVAAMVMAIESTLVSECQRLDSPFTTYVLSKDVVIGKGSVCFEIVEDGITLDGNGFKITSAEQVDAIAVKCSGLYATIKNLHITNFKTGIQTSGKYGKIQHNTITETSDGINVSSTHNEVSYNTIQGTFTAGTSAGIYVYFPSTTPTEAFMSITNNEISNIQGSDFALGIVVYYATSVFVGQNTISDLTGAVTQEISVIGGEAEIKDNVFITTPAATFSITSAALLSVAIVLASAVWFFTPATKSAALNVVPFPEEKEETEEKRKEREANEARDGPRSPERRPLSFAVGASPRLNNLKGSGRWGISALSFSTDFLTNPLSSSTQLKDSTHLKDSTQ